jgi:hypothetical protein
MGRLKQFFRDPERLGYVRWGIGTFAWTLVAIAGAVHGFFTSLAFLIPAAVSGYFAWRSLRAGYS